jgi:hypothetical protein
MNYFLTFSSFKGFGDAKVILFGIQAKQIVRSGCQKYKMQRDVFLEKIPTGG